MHFDVDLFEPTSHVLNAIWDQVPKGGIELFDECGIEDWPGESWAEDEFLKSHPLHKVKTLNWTDTPAGCIVTNKEQNLRWLGVVSSSIKPPQDSFGTHQKNVSAAIETCVFDICT